MVHRDDSNNPDLSECEPRDFEAVKPVLKLAFGAFGRYLREVRSKSTRLISDTDKELLDFCTEISMFPLMPAVLNFESPYEGFNPCDYFVQDLGHSLIGLGRNWCFYTYVMIAKTGRKYFNRDKFGQGTAKLDAALANMKNLLQGCLPYEHSHFDRGMSLYCHGERSSKKSRATQSGMTKLDSSKVKDLILQMLICEFLHPNLLAPKACYFFANIT